MHYEEITLTLGVYVGDESHTAAVALAAAQQVLKSTYNVATVTDGDRLWVDESNLLNRSIRTGEVMREVIVGSKEVREIAGRVRFEQTRPYSDYKTLGELANQMERDENE